MTASNEREARRALLRSTRAVVSCISWAVVTGGAGGRSAPENLVIPQRHVPLSGRYRLEFSLRHSFEVRQSEAGWTVGTTGYFYQLRERAGPEIIAFHWHPNQRDQPDFPHLHMRSRSGAVEIERKNHVPTGHVSLESVVRFAIVELAVQPLRPDWDTVLADGEQHFAASRQG